jgi:hypothetical protein
MATAEPPKLLREGSIPSPPATVERPVEKKESERNKRVEIKKWMKQNGSADVEEDVQERRRRRGRRWRGGDDVLRW